MSDEKNDQRAVPKAPTHGERRADDSENPGDAGVGQHPNDAKKSAGNPPHRLHRLQKPARKSRPPCPCRRKGRLA